MVGVVRSVVLLLMYIVLLIRDWSAEQKHVRRLLICLLKKWELIGTNCVHGIINYVLRQLKDNVELRGLF